MSMQGRIEQIGADFVTGWFASGNESGEATRVEVWVDGTLVASAPLNQSRSEIAHMDGCKAEFRIAVPPLSDIAALLGRRSLRIRAHVSGRRVVHIGFQQSCLHPAILRSTTLLFGDRPCESVLVDLASLSSQEDTSHGCTILAAQLCDAMRLFFPPEERPANFDHIAAELSRAAGREAAARHYRARLEGKPHPSAREPRRNHRGLSYARFTDIVGSGQTLPVQAQKARFLSGAADGGYLINAGGLEGVASVSDRGVAAPEGHLHTVWFGLQSFGDEHWRYRSATGEVMAPVEFYLIDFEQLREVIDRGGVLVIDQSAEGPPAHAEWVRCINQAVDDLGIAGRHVFVNQNFAFPDFGAERGLTSPHVPGQFYFLRGATELAALFPTKAAVQRHIDTTLGQRHASTALRKFSCLNFTPRWPRWAVALSLCYGGFIPDGYFSFPGRCSTKVSVEGSIAQLLPPLRNRDRMVAVVDSFLANAPYIVDTDVRSGLAPEFVFPEVIGSNSLLHIVTETEMSSGEVLRITEKILKPIVALQPFIVFGNPHSLEIMRNMGFQTFGDVIDESYDEIVNFIDRFDTMEELIHGLLVEDTAALHARLRAAEDVCVHNFMHLIHVWPTLISSGMMRGIVREIIAIGASTID